MLTFASAIPGDQGSDDRLHSMVARVGIQLCDVAIAFPVISACTCDAYPARRGLGGPVMADERDHRAPLPPARNTAIDELWVNLPQLLVAEAEAGHDAGAHILDE